MKSLAFKSCNHDFIIQMYGEKAKKKWKKPINCGNFYLFRFCLKSDGDILA